MARFRECRQSNSLVKRTTIFCCVLCQKSYIHHVYCESPHCLFYQMNSILNCFFPCYKNSELLFRHCYIGSDRYITCCLEGSYLYVYSSYTFMFDTVPRNRGVEHKENFFIKFNDSLQYILPSTEVLVWSLLKRISQHLIEFFCMMNFQYRKILSISS